MKNRLGIELRRATPSTSEPTDVELALSLVASHIVDASSFDATRSTSSQLLTLTRVSRSVRSGVGPLLARQAAVGPSHAALRAFYLSPTLSTLSPGLLQTLRLRLYGTVDDQHLAFAILAYAPCLRQLELDMLEAPTPALLSAVATLPLRKLELRQTAACAAIVQLVPRLARLRRLRVDAACGTSSLGRIIGAVCTRRGVTLDVELDAL